MRWIVVQTKPRQEKKAGENLARQGVEFYLPKILVDASKQKTELLFPSYLFARVDNLWRFIENTYGVTRVIMMGDSPAVMQDIEIEQIKIMENKEGLIVPPDLVEDELKIGESLRVTDGPFSGFWGELEAITAQQRVFVLLEILGRQTRVELSRGQVERE